MHGFTLTLVDGGGPGEKLDTLQLAVGPANPGSATPLAEVAAGESLIEVGATLEVRAIQLPTFAFEG